MHAQNNKQQSIYTYLPIYLNVHSLVYIWVNETKCNLFWCAKRRVALHKALPHHVVWAALNDNDTGTKRTLHRITIDKVMKLWNVAVCDINVREYWYEQHIGRVGGCVGGCAILFGFPLYSSIV